MFINFSNHPSGRWDEKQVKAATLYGEILDIQFPEVSPVANEDDIELLAKKCVNTIKKNLSKDSAVMVQGEFTLTYAIVRLLMQDGIKVVSACSERNVTEDTDIDGNIVRKVRFDFKRFREYR